MKRSPVTSAGLVVIALGTAFYGYAYAPDAEQIAYYFVAVIAAVVALVTKPRKSRYDHQ